ncbi:MAG: tetratricopeptide repeat protein [Calditrichaeota bacterium]|nr:MAG: tetratricopeptide repeat protein [Calditrichota bacterium]
MFCRIKSPFWWLGFFIGLLISSNSFAQLSAVDWFKAGLKSPILDEKIEAFENAVRLDPNFVEAYYFLGLAYKKKGEFEKALIAFNKAYYQNRYGLTREIKARILFELGSIYKQLERYSESIEALEEAKQTVQNSILKSKIYYVLGQVYEAVGNFNEALDQFNQGKDILPKNAAMFEEAIMRLEKQINLHAQYRAALTLMKQKDYGEARKLLLKILQKEPDYKMATEKLHEVDRLLTQQKVKNEPLAKSDLKRQATKSISSAVTARKIKSKTVKKLSRKFKSFNQKKRAQKAEQQKIAQQLEVWYKQGLMAVENGDWSEAVQAFEKVYKTNPNYQDIDDRLADAQFHVMKAKIEPQLTTKEQNFNGLLLVSFVLMTLVMVAFIIWMTSPNLRARVYLSRGNYDRAALIYEKQLIKHPDRVYYYATLANIYLMANRRDEKALKVYEKTLKLNLYTQFKEIISSILANYYLQEGRTDEYALNLMEKALNNKLRRINF